MAVGVIERIEDWVPIMVLLSCVFGGLMLLMKGIEFLDERPHVVGRMLGPIRWLRRHQRVVLAIGFSASMDYVMWRWPELRLIGLIGLFVFLVVWFWRELCSGIRVLYRRVLWRVIVRPARDHFGVEATRQAFDLDADLAERFRRGGMRGLSNDGLAVLAEALSRTERGDREVVVHYPEGVHLHPPEAGRPRAKERFTEAGEELLAGAWITGYGETLDRPRGGFGMWVLLPTGKPYWVQRLGVEARLEMVRRSILERMQEATPVVDRDQWSSEEAVWTKEVAQLSIVASWLLHRILYFHERYSGDRVHAVWRGRRAAGGSNGRERGGYLPSVG